LEHRYLIASLMLPRIQGCELVFLSCEKPTQEILDYYVSLVAPERRTGMQRRFRPVTVPDRSARPVAAKLLDRPDLLDGLRASLDGRPAHIEPWNVTEVEVEVAARLRVPINGTPPKLWPVGYKSAGRKLFRRAGVPVPVGHEDVRTADDVVDAVSAIRAARPNCQGVVVKHDDSGAGDGNVVLDLGGVPDGELTAHTRAWFDRLPEWYRRDLAAGGVVEERISGTRFTSPSVQLDIAPSGEVTIRSTHEQELGGEDGQVYTGCRFPADPAYAAELARHGLAIGCQLASLGALGRAAVDFAASCDERGRWSLYVLEVNLRKGGTTHPYTALRHLAPGVYDATNGRWVTQRGEPRAYCATDNLLDPGWVGRPPSSVMAAIVSAQLEYDWRTQTGVVLHMLSCLAIDGRFGLTAIGRDEQHASELYDTARAAVAAG
jgi:hypothetical protein